MRFHTSSVLLSALLLSLPISVAYGDTFAFTPAGGTTLTFALNDSLLNEFIAPSYGIAFGPVVIDNHTDEIIFYNPAYLVSIGAGPIDFAIDYDIDIPSKTGVVYYDGIQLYSGSETSPVFTPGTYHLDNSVFEPNGPGTLVIDGSPVPEPSTLVLLGIGVLGCFEVIRRKTVCA
jgi:hypothetical protein